MSTSPSSALGTSCLSPAASPAVLDLIYIFGRLSGITVAIELKDTLGIDTFTVSITVLELMHRG